MKKQREEAFLFSTFAEFNKCWRSGAKARVIMETFNGAAFVNFSAFLGYPNDVHFHSRPEKRNPPKKPRRKSEKKVKRDNERAARFQSKKRNEDDEAATASKPADNSEATESSSPSPGIESESVVTNSDIEFSFASPVPENLRHTSQDTSLVLSDNNTPHASAKKERRAQQFLNRSLLKCEEEQETVLETLQYDTSQETSFVFSNKK